MVEVTSKWLSVWRANRVRIRLLFLKKNIRNCPVALEGFPRGAGFQTVSIKLRSAFENISRPMNIVTTRHPRQ